MRTLFLASVSCILLAAFTPATIADEERATKRPLHRGRLAVIDVSRALESYQPYKNSSEQCKSRLYAEAFSKMHGELVKYCGAHGIELVMCIDPIKSANDLRATMRDVPETCGQSRLIIGRGQVFYFADDIDITDAVIRQMNAHTSQQ